jgi:uncharacterized XkdX family phage protein
MFEIIKDFYDSGFYTKSEIAEFTAAEWITPEQYQEITGETYEG